MTNAQEQQERLENINLYLKPGFELSILEETDYTRLLAWAWGSYHDGMTDEIQDKLDEWECEILAVDDYHYDNIDSYISAMEYMIENRANKPYKC